MSKLGLIHYNYASPSLDDFLKFTSETGFGYVELQIGDVWNSETADPEKNAEAVRAQVEGYGLQVSALAAGNDFVLLEEGSYPIPSGADGNGSLDSLNGLALQCSGQKAVPRRMLCLKADGLRRWLAA